MFLLDRTKTKLSFFCFKEASGINNQGENYALVHPTLFIKRLFIFEFSNVYPFQNQKTIIRYGG